MEHEAALSFRTVDGQVKSVQGVDGTVYSSDRFKVQSRADRRQEVKFDDKLRNSYSILGNENREPHNTTLPKDLEKTAALN